jgi:hypothetical protein
MICPVHSHRAARPHFVSSDFAKILENVRAESAGRVILPPSVMLSEVRRQTNGVEAPRVCAQCLRRLRAFPPRLTALMGPSKLNSLLKMSIQVNSDYTAVGAFDSARRLPSLRSG